MATFSHGKWTYSVTLVGAGQAQAQQTNTQTGAVRAVRRRGGSGPQQPSVCTPPAAPPSSTQTPYPCAFCRHRPRNATHPYCGRTCGAAAKKAGWLDGKPPHPPAPSLCALCHAKPRNPPHPYCGHTCGQFATQVGWRHGSPPPQALPPLGLPAPAGLSPGPAAAAAPMTTTTPTTTTMAGSWSFDGGNGVWTTYNGPTQSLLEAAFVQGQPMATFSHGKWTYSVTLVGAGQAQAQQTNTQTGAVRVSAPFRSLVWRLLTEIPLCHGCQEIFRFETAHQAVRRVPSGGGHAAGTGMPTTVQVQCPPATHAGQPLYIQAADGQTHCVTVPPGVAPGVVFHVRLG
jgi:hypothetical protein